MSDLEINTTHSIDITKDSESPYDTLISLLRKECETYEELYTIFMRETDILSDASLDELYENNAKKETCILKAKMLDQSRSQLVGSIARNGGYAEKDVTLSLLISHSDDRRARDLTKCRDTLRSLLSDINEISEKNKVLLDSSLVYVQRSIQFIGQFMSPGTTYMSGGALRNNPTHGRIISREG